MFGDFFDQNNEKYAFHLCFDYNGEVTGKKYAIFIEYGKEKIKHKWVIEDKSDIFILAENINQFLIKYLTYLKSLPIPNPKYPKIDKLLNNHKKLYDYVAKYNWDDGIEEMEYIVKNNNCDKATALLIYWLCIPYYFDDRTGKELKLLPYIIEENFTNNYYQNSENKFDPENNQLENFIKSYKQSKDCVRTLPNHMVKMKV
ncbi:hypothetical protein A2476_00695 [candidate division CPR3 bacterium RIFOXYC2_FULL_35_7]|nr:MAG: hypothetical protein A2476_00695 [candidate division CPR3 bacterium RIFOXYC2_FULL_35_7]